jgi:hypothetical protein
MAEHTRRDSDDACLRFAPERHRCSGRAAGANVVAARQRVKGARRWVRQKDTFSCPIVLQATGSSSVSFLGKANSETKARR